MKRAFIFLLLGPAFVVAAWLLYAVAQGAPWGTAEIVAVCLFVFTFLVAALAALLDSFLAGTLPVLVRAPLIALLGGAVPVVALLAVVGCMLPQSFLTPFGIGGALCMGVCSLLSNDDGHRQRLPGVETQYSAFAGT
jgi:hypothetical protein